MQRLIAIGYWNDGSDGCSLHNPQEFVDSRGSVALRESIFHYLQGGRSGAQYLGYSWCRFDCGIDETKMGSADLTDGVWIWPEGLAHYVACHDVRLPAEFIEHARANGFQTPTPVFEDDAVGDFDFWIEWCDSNTNGDPEAQKLWRRTQDEIDSADRAIVEKLIEKHGGLSETTCAWAGCEDLALRELAFCPSCAHNKMNYWP